MTFVLNHRMQNLRARMRDTGTDLVALGPASHMRWLIGLEAHGDERPVMLLLSATRAALLMPALNAEDARQHTDLPLFTWHDHEGPAQALQALLADLQLPNTEVSLVLDESMRADYALLLLDALPGLCRRRFSEDTVGLLRSRKDTEEQQALRASARLNDEAVRHAVQQLQPGMRERDVQACIHTYYQAHGAQAEFTIVGFGANSAYPHHHSGDTRLQENMPVLIDTGCRLDGYPSDMTRCFVFGEAEAEYQRVFALVEQALQAALQVARPGVRAAEVDAAARDVIKQAGYGDYFPHRLGHGLGIDVHEPPYLHAGADTRLHSGHVFSIEPGIYLPGRFGVRLEEIVVLHDNGSDILSALPRDRSRWADC